LPAETVYIFDACAVVALLKSEAGANVVEDLLRGESNR
jgi:PIN domain nuclease of toxin-antitoxin system